MTKDRANHWSLRPKLKPDFYQFILRHRLNNRVIWKLVPTTLTVSFANAPNQEHMEDVFFPYPDRVVGKDHVAFFLADFIQLWSRWRIWENTKYKAERNTCSSTYYFVLRIEDSMWTCSIRRILGSYEAPLYRDASQTILCYGSNCTRALAFEGLLDIRCSVFIIVSVMTDPVRPKKILDQLLYSYSQQTFYLKAQILLRSQYSVAYGPRYI